MSDPETPQEKTPPLGTPRCGTANEMQHEAASALKRMADRVSDSMYDMAMQGKDAAQEAEHLLEKQTRHLRVTAEHYIQDAPFKSILIAAGTGAATALVASWLIRSHKH